MCYQSHGNGMYGIQCLHVRLMTSNLSLHFSVAMVPVVDLLLCSLTNSHHLLVISNIVNCYGIRQPT